MTGERNRGNNRGCTFSVLPQDRDFATRCHLQNISADNWNEDYFYLIKKECNKWDSAGVDPLDWASMFCQLLPNKNSWSVTGKKSEPRAQKTGAMQLRKKEKSATGSFLFAFEEETEWLSGRWLVVSFLHVDGDLCNVFLFGQELTRGGRSEVFNCSHVTLVVA